MKFEYLWSFHYFRAFAILNIVVLHLWVLPADDSLLVHTQVLLKEVLFHDSTIYFIFISGFLVMHLKERFTLYSYYKSKLKHVLVPYVVISISLITIYALFGSKTENLTIEFMARSVMAILLGKVNFHFWYIPFITLIFIITPFILKINRKIICYTAPLFFVLPLLGTRTGTEITIGQYVYFFPIYIIGMVVNLKLEKVRLFVKVYNQLIVTTFFLSLTVLLFLLAKYDFRISYPNYFESLYYINRITVILLFVKFSSEIGYNKYPVIGKIADYSFAIYFLHWAIGNFFQPFFFRILADFNHLYWIPLSLLFTICVIFFCFAIIRSVKFMLGKWSKPLIGY